LIDDDDAPPPSATTPEERRRAFRLLFVSLACLGMGQSLLLSILPPLSRDLGMSEWQVGAIFALSALLWVVASPFWGRKSDHMGRKPIILIGLIGFAGSMVLLGLVIQAGLSGWMALSVAFPLMIVTRGVFGLLGSGTFPASQAYVADRTTRRERTAALATIGAAFGMGVIVGPGIAALLVDWGILAPIYIVAAIAAASAVAVWRMLPERTPPRGLRAAPRVGSWDVRIRPFVIASIVMSACQAGTMQTVGFYMIDLLELDADRAVRQVGIGLTLSAAASLFMQLVVIRRFQPAPRTLLYGGVTISFACFVLFALSNGYLPIMAALIVLGLGFGMLRPGIAAAGSLAVAYDEQGSAAGVINGLGAAGHVVSPFVALPLYEVWIHAPYVLNAVLMAGLLAYILTSRQVRAVTVHRHRS
jgi:MFS family permease